MFTEDLLKLLPPKSREKVIRLDGDRDAAHAAYSAASDREQAARQELTLREGLLRRKLDELGPVGAWTKSEADRLTEERNAALFSEIEPLRQRHAAALAARERATEVWRRYAFLDECAQWLRNLGTGVALKHCAVPPPKAPKGFVAEVDKIRSELAALDDGWTAVEKAPAPTEDLIGRAIRAIDEIAERGKPNVDVTSRGGDPVQLAKLLSVKAERYSDVTLLSGDAGAAFWTWLWRDEIVERITALIKEAPQKGALTDADRDRRFADIAARRLELERLEEACILAAEQQGQLIPRRREADPRAVLEVEV